MPTAHKAVELLASGFEVLGTFLLAVEAIKLPNLHKLRTGLFEKPLRRIVPRILVRESASATEIEQLKERAQTRFFLILAAIGFSMLLLVAIVIAASLSALWAAFHSTLIRPPLWAMIVRIFLGAVGTFGISLIIGFALYRLVLAVFSFPVRTLSWIETNTANGVIGILGFLLFLIGAAVHAYMNWIAP